MSDKLTGKVNHILIEICMLYRDIISDTNAVLSVLEDMPDIDKEVKDHIVNFRALNIGRLADVQKRIDAMKELCFNSIPDSVTKH